jgi:hypothetical protein
MKTETKINMAFAILFALMALLCFVGAAFCEAWWHLYSCLMCVGLTRIFIIARDDSGDNAWKWICELFTIDNLN